MEEKSVIWSIQYLRGVAALMVVWHHAKAQLPGLTVQFPSGFGAAGVALFFVISGFIMLVTAAKNQQSTLQFWMRRIKRVVPLYWLLTLLMVVLWLVKPSFFKSLTVSWATLIQSLLFVPHFSASFPDREWPLLVPGWSLNYELFFYCLFGLVIATPRRLWVISTSAILLTLVSLGCFVGPFDDALKRVYTSPLLLEFLFGVWIGSLWLKQRLSLPFWLSIAMILVGTILLVGQGFWSGGLLANGIGAACVVMGVLHPKIAALQSRSLRVLGDSSYSLYLTHIFSLGALRYCWVEIMPSGFATENGIIFMVTALSVSVAVGVIVFRYLELPMTRLSFRQNSRH